MKSKAKCFRTVRLFLSQKVHTHSSPALLPFPVYCSKIMLIRYGIHYRYKIRSVVLTGKGSYMGQKYTFQGHTFDDEKQYVAAQKEAEAIEYLRSKTDFGNMNNLMKLYNRILDRDMMETVIGIEFLKEIRGTLVGSGMFKEDQVRPVPLLPEVKKLKKRNEIQKRSRERTLMERLEHQNTVLKIWCFFLVVLVIGMFIIALTGKRSPLAIRYEEQLINRYASWAEDLRQKEEMLREYVRKLEQQGIAVPEWEENGGTD